MRVRVIYFAAYRDLTGVAGEGVQLPEGAKVEELVEAVKGLHGAPDEWGNVVVAVNGEFAEGALVLREGDLVALFPPVSGG